MPYLFQGDPQAGFLQGVPARSLSDAEFEALDPERRHAVEVAVRPDGQPMYQHEAEPDAGTPPADPGQPEPPAGEFAVEPPAEPAEPGA